MESIVHFREVDGAWVPHAVVQLVIEADRIALVRDYVHVDYLLRGCVVEIIPRAPRTRPPDQGERP